MLDELEKVMAQESKLTSIILMSHCHIIEVKQIIKQKYLHFLKALCKRSFKKFKKNY